VVAQDIFSTETTELADVVLPAATWAEKTGTFTNADRTVHLSERAVAPPGEAKSDLAIFLDLAKRLDLRNQHDEPLIGWDDPEGAFEAWKACSAGRPCDYTGMTYELLRGGGIQWPCTTEQPEGTERLYVDGAFAASPDVCEDYGHDLLTGAPAEPVEYKALNPSGKAMIKAAHFRPPVEDPDEDHPYTLITGRTVYHFHTRTRTGRAPELQAAAPEVWVEMAASDADRHGWLEGDLLEVTTPRGAVRARLRVSGIRPGVIFVPFHYGYWDRPGSDGGDESSHGDANDRDRAANELTITTWDPCSKQPIFKTAAAQVVRIEPTDGAPSPAPMVGGSARVDDVREG
jgi:anaerobic selenocysteine-containing dehydrogenase